MSKENKLIPELRFPEFVKDGEWMVKTIGQVARVTTGNKDTQNKVNNGKYPFFVRSQEVEQINSYSYDGEAILTSGDGVGVGKNFHYINGKFDFHQRVYCIYDFSNEVCGKFIYMYFSQHFYERVMRMSAKNSVDSVRMAMVTEMPILLPSKEEQQKIATCLSSLDELIAAHNDKLQALKEHKKGLMQNLFPQEGEKVPKYRFPEFVEDGEWEEKPLDEICKLVRGPFGGALKKEIFVKEGYAVYEQSHAIHRDFNSFRYRINENKYSELKRFAVNAGDLIMSCSGTMGKFAVIPDDYEQGVINQALLKLTAKKGHNNSFVKVSLEIETNQKKLLSQSAGGAIKNVVSVSKIRELELAIPKPKEQQKIASCLSSLDELITAETEKIEQLQWHKKGLMQGLFPKINE